MKGMQNLLGNRADVGPVVHASTVHTGRDRDQQFCGEVLHPGRADRIDCLAAASLAQRMFPSTLKQYGTDAFGIARARNGDTSNPFYRIRRWLRKSSPEARNLFMADFRTFLLALMDCDVSDESIRAASIAEQEAEGDENVVQLRLHADVQANLEHARFVFTASAAQKLLLAAMCEKRIAG
jgi:hypothetical protein